MADNLTTGILTEVATVLISSSMTTPDEWPSQKWKIVISATALAGFLALFAISILGLLKLCLHRYRKKENELMNQKTTSVSLKVIEEWGKSFQEETVEEREYHHSQNRPSIVSFESSEHYKIPREEVSADDYGKGPGELDNS